MYRIHMAQFDHWFIKGSTSIIAGFLFAGVLLLIGVNTATEEIRSVLLWHWKPIYSLAGNGPLLGHTADGTPIYEGTPVHVLFGLLGMFAGFMIYPVSIFIIWSLVDKFRSKQLERQFRNKEWN